ncbi:deoxyribodipyrimidine photo-lyase [Mycolicibacterium chitae]|uniref:Deoxyribodipyrimidine photolyase n=1 Tax=Mycolicibacterium chitae TaxID=1792 RepID=A0A448I847_MYCCI|nr:deoxyribodipyrimidine photo-lyase [Mycolicibacterium chitae]MCV7105935.1 deoxyribodipyrimidine photo-lyase [Mycolicibacterium chitae]BBZ05070.1 deoxyribodipyrimidine photo-lyase [Mycolicibacterium chitae]VEG48691.1 deoxyribodipyrimidine photolyase [Mycolicibacterium chitae]
MTQRLLWLRRDLRLADHPALLAAAADDAEVLACHVLEPRLTAHAGPRRLQFLYDSLRELRDRLDGRLLITRGRAESRIPALAKAIGAESVHVSADYTPFSLRRDEAVRAALGDIALQATGSPYLVAPGRVTKSDDTAYQVFTPYYRRWLDHGWRAPARSGAGSARWIDPAAVGEKNHGIPDPGVDLELPAGEQAARRRWARFVEDHLADYAEQRDRPDLEATSRMSAHLHFGTIHPRTLAADLAASEPGPQAYLRELAFRDFYAAVLAAWPRSAWWNFNPAFDAIEVDRDAAAERAFDTWRDGRTGFPLVDAGMRQLRETGFMHNRVRMITASFLVKDLHLPWQWGARWFLDQLVDGDVASNQHGWQWAAGSGTDASPYFRVFNPDTQRKKFDPTGDYVRRWVPELGTEDYPEPLVDHGEERQEALRRYGAIG